MGSGDLVSVFTLPGVDSLSNPSFLDILLEINHHPLPG